MNIDIRKNIINNFSTASMDEFIDSIETSINDNEEITLPGLGVFFEIIWKNSNKEEKEKLVNILMSKIKST
ncbi:MAG TPA: small acid-soluble spore protein SspI [Bacilli bacterium]|nr:small acid-soluble spore protein SspI [Bacilli bacterium]